MSDIPAPEKPKKPEELGLPEGVIHTDSYENKLHVEVGSKLGAMEDLTSSEKDPIPAFGKEPIEGHPNQWKAEKVANVVEDQGESKEESIPGLATAQKVVEHLDPREGLDLYGRLTEGDKFYEKGFARAQAKAKRHGLELIAGGNTSPQESQEEKAA